MRRDSWRGPGPGRPDLPLPPDKVPIRRDGNWRKRWRYLGAFSDELMLCAARVQVGPIGQTFWAIWDREPRRAARAHPRERPGPRPRRGLDRARRGRARRADRLGARARRHPGPDRGREARSPSSEHVRAFLRAGEGAWVEASARPARSDNYVWTRKRAVAVELRRAHRRAADPTCEARGVEDESCGYHPHHTVWDWSAGVGRDRRRSRRRLEPGQRDQRPAAALRARDLGRRRAPASRRRRRFDGLDAIDVGGARLEFSAEAERRKARTGRSVEVLLPPAVRHLHRHAPRRARARRRASA